MLAATAYFGEWTVKLDEKSRITVPSRIRDIMRVFSFDSWFMAPGDNQSIFLFDREGWANLRHNAGKAGQSDEESLAFRRIFFSLTEESRPDPQGRMPLPEHVRKHAAIEKEAVVIGVDDHLEVWNREVWNAFKSRNTGLYDQLAPPLLSIRGNNGASTGKGGESHES